MSETLWVVWSYVILNLLDVSETLWVVWSCVILKLLVMSRHILCQLHGHSVRLRLSAWKLGGNIVVMGWSVRILFMFGRARC